MVFMTDDAVPADERLIEHLAAAFDKRGPGGESVIMAYARQLPDKDCPMAERFTSSFNYPEDSCIKTKEDLGRMGIKTFFASNVCCAYDREKFWFQGGFIQKTIFNEDMIFAGKAVLQDDYAIAYVAEARVIHSHNYGCAAQFHRRISTWPCPRQTIRRCLQGIHSERARNPSGQTDSPLPCDPPPSMAGARTDCKERIQIRWLPPGQVLPFPSCEAGGSVQYE